MRSPCHGDTSAIDTSGPPPAAGQPARITRDRDRRAPRLGSSASPRDRSSYAAVGYIAMQLGLYPLASELDAIERDDLRTLVRWAKHLLSADQLEIPKIAYGSGI